MEEKFLSCDLSGESLDSPGWTVDSWEKGNIMSDNVLSFSTTVLIVYGVSGSFFILLVGLLYIVGLTPSTPLK